MSIYHKHHIVPRHAGGTDDPSNIIELTVEEHAEAHKKLYEDHGRWQDEIAWKTLSGQIGKEEAQKIAVQKALTGVPKSREHRAKISEGQIGKKKSPKHIKNISKCRTGVEHSEDTKKSISEGIKKHWEKRKDMPVKEITKKRRSESIKKWWAERKNHL